MSIAECGVRSEDVGVCCPANGPLHSAGSAESVLIPAVRSLNYREHCMPRFAHVLLSLALLLVSAPLTAGEVVVKGVHLCCPDCVSAVDEALGGVQGVSRVTADRDARQVTFTAADAKAAQAGINALAKAGFHGAASHGKDAVPFPASGARSGQKADRITLGGAHLCCSGCVADAHKALADLDGLSVIDIDRTAATITLSGSAIDVSGAVKALNAGGFFATVKLRN